MYMCEKCGKEFHYRKQLVDHLRKKLSCVTQNGSDILKAEIDKLIDKFNAVDEDGLTDDRKKYLQKKLSNINLMYGNLPKEKQPEIKEIFNEELMPLYEKYGLVLEEDDN